ncbi:hypothetical protein EW145_g5659 [Phellinidium pouzarii]|uniref:Thioredoxin domain-containing protein n=1 Tax=Phellinidium pouzarii TaxID=167371 RepID=A0A4S4KZ97_9AGAM|nr:hypothetical protein EW145_g5659 [Phellinidium pouzarii]
MSVTTATTPTPANLHQITSPTHLQALLSADLTRPSLLSFWAAWAAPCAATNARVAELAREYGGSGKGSDRTGLLVLEVEADKEETADVAESFEVVSVPTFVLLRVRVFFLFFIYR